jgi:hypothetical protein
MRCSTESPLTPIANSRDRDAKEIGGLYTTLALYEAFGPLMRNLFSGYSLCFNLIWNSWKY